MFSPPFSFAQQPVTGTIRSGDAPVAGVTVTVKGTQTAVLTDESGKFSINAAANATLVFTHVNYNPLERQVPRSGAFDIQLELLNNSLGEVVVVGYNVQKKATVTGSISVVKGSDLVKSPQANVSNSWQAAFQGL